jgi:hypothetical protein
MSALFKKLNLTNQSPIVVIDAPASFEREIAQLEGVTVLRAWPPGEPCAFVLAFVTTLADVQRVARDVAPRLEGDALLWCAYPKGTSRRYRCEFNRDAGWSSIGAAGFEAVRQVAIDEDWSAMRFRRVEYIATLRRDPSRAMSARGKARAGEARSPRA